MYKWLLVATYRNYLLVSNFSNTQSSIGPQLPPRIRPVYFRYIWFTIHYVSVMSLATRFSFFEYISSFRCSFCNNESTLLVTTLYFNVFIKTLTISRTWPTPTLFVVPFRVHLLLLYTTAWKTYWQDMNMQSELQNWNYPQGQHFREAGHKDPHSPKVHVFEVTGQGEGLAVDSFKHLLWWETFCLETLRATSPSGLDQGVDFSSSLWLNSLV